MYLTEQDYRDDDFRAEGLELEAEENMVSNCCSAAVSDPSGEGKEGRCTDCGEMCQIVSNDEE